MARPPLESYLWNPTQWQGSRKVQRMSWAERGLYRELMDECYLHGSIPGTAEGVAEMIGEDLEEIAPLWAKVARCFTPAPGLPGRVISPFIEEVRSRQSAVREARSAAGRKGNESRWAHRNCDGLDRNCDEGDRKSSQAVANDREEVSKERVGRDDSSHRSESLSPRPPTPLVADEAPAPAPAPRAKGRRGMKASTVDALLAVPDVASEDIALGAEILSMWHKADPVDGRPIGGDARELVMRLVAIQARQVLFTRDVLRVAAKNYLAKPRQRYMAPECFFSLKPRHGEDKPPFLELASAEVNRLKIAAATAPVAPTATT